MAVPDSNVQHAYRVRVSQFRLAVILAMVVFVVGYQGIQAFGSIVGEWGRSMVVRMTLMLT